MNKDDYPSWVCMECGTKCGRLGRLKGPATFHINTCDMCKEEKSVTEPRDFGHLVDNWRKFRAK